MMHNRLVVLSAAALMQFLLTTRSAAETDWVLVLDRSESMTQNDPYNCRFDAQKILVDLLVQGLDETHRLTIIRFAGTPEAVLSREVVRPQNLEALRKLISEDPPLGDTDIGAALSLARKIVQPEGRAADVHLFLLSDGVQAGKTPNLAGRLDEEKRGLQEIGLAINTILLNDFSIPKAEREKRRREKLYYEDKQLQAGEDLLRDLARKTGGAAAQVQPERGIEDILIELIAPHMSFHREPISARLATWPTDRQLFCVFQRNARDVKLRIGSREMDINLDNPKLISGEFDATITPYRNRTVVVLSPGENVRWPEWVEFLPSRSGVPASGDVFVISNVRLEALPGLGDEGTVAAEGVKTKISENEVYPIRFRISLPADLTPERARSIQDTLKKSSVKIELSDSEGKILDNKSLSAAEISAGAGNRLYFIPTSSPKGEAKIQESFFLRTKASLVYTGASADSAVSKRPLSRAPDRSFMVVPSSFDWFVRKNWKGEPESASRPASRRNVDVELGQEVRLELTYGGQESLAETEVSATFGAVGESAARRLRMKDSGGVPRTFSSDWIFPTTPGLYEAKVTVKAGGVQEALFSLRVLRDDFRPPGSQYSKDGTDSAQGRDLGAFYQGEIVQISRSRTMNHLTPAATAQYWETESSAPSKISLLKRDDASGSWVLVRQVTLVSETPRSGDAEISANYRGELGGLEPGIYLIAWPEKRPMGPDPTSDQRCDRLEVKPRAFTAGFTSEGGRALETEAGKPTVLAGSPLLFRVSPSQVFPDKVKSSIAGTLTWARKDVGAPQEVKAVKELDGHYSLAFATTDFHTGPAKLHVVMKWNDGSMDRVITEDYEVFSRTRALGIVIEPIDGDVLLGQRGSAIRFRLRAMGGQNAQTQRDLLSVWQSQPANVTIGESEQIHHVDLTLQGDALIGTLEAVVLDPGTHKLVVSSPLAKLGQDIAACFFNVRPCPFSATVVKSSQGTDQRVLLGAGTDQSSSQGEGVIWVSVEPASATGKTGTEKVVSAELYLNGRKGDIRWSEAEGKFRSEPISLESLEKRNTLALTISDAGGRTFELSLGTLDVNPVSLKYEVAWTKSPPSDIGRGERTYIEGAVIVRGGLKSQREEAGKELILRPFISTTPANVLEGFELLPPPKEATLEALFGVRIEFAAYLNAAAEKGLKDSFVVSVNTREGEAIEQRKVAIGPSTLQLVFSRAEEQDLGAGATVLPFMARERLRVTIEGQAPQRNSRIQLYSGGEVDAASTQMASSDSTELVWSPKKEGNYRVRAEASLGQGTSWTVEEKFLVEPPLKLQWSRDLGTTIKLDDGQKLPLSVKISGPPSLDKESFDRLFVLRPGLLGEGAQQLNVEFTQWEAEKGTPPGVLILNSFSTKPLSTSAVKVRLRLTDRAAEPNAIEFDGLDLDIVRGGGTLVEVMSFEKGPSGYETRDLPPVFSIPRDSSIRLGYRIGGLVESEDSLRKSVAAIVVSEDGREKVLDVDTATSGLVVFVPYTPAGFGKHTLQLDIRGKTPLQRKFEFEATKGSTERAYTGLLYGALAGLVVLLGFLGIRGLGYYRDRQQVLERVSVRKDKAIHDLEAEPRESLTGSLRITLANRTIGPLELNGKVSGAEVEAWVTDHFSMETSIFSDPQRNAKRLKLIQDRLSEVRTELCLETEKRLPIRGADVCIAQGEGARNGDSCPDVFVLHDGAGRKGEGEKSLLSLRLQPDGKLRITTASGRSVTLTPGEDFPYNGWVGKSGNQLRASVKVPGVVDYSTIIVDW